MKVNFVPGGKQGGLNGRLSRYARVLSAAKIGAAPWAGQSAGGCYLVSAGRTVKPELAVSALLLIETLFFFALGALTIHFALIDIIGQQQAAARTFPGFVVVDGGAAAWQRADKNRLAGAAPVFAFFLFLTNRAFFHGQSLFKDGSNKYRVTRLKQITR
jgi:hypothetical protein